MDTEYRINIGKYHSGGVIGVFESAVQAHGGGIDYFIGTCFNYPSLGELFKYASYSALQAIAAHDEANAAPLAA